LRERERLWLTANRGDPASVACPSGAPAARPTGAHQICGFNDHHLSRSWSSAKGFRSAVKPFVAAAQQRLGSRESAALPLIANAACVPRASANSLQLTARLMTGWKAASTALGMQDGASGKSWPRILPSEPLSAILLLSPTAARHGVPLAFYGDHRHLGSQ